eukprot:TRINITY_DN18847_c0_g1_i1.p2 TRINITY_DN18847_c0_g1~~TRINITY_DN18847_c0_g1_i1.p2  ORF type:complete len:206 (+),score=16.75 TRINITY_DN18847_c0_g1_i1:137-754(+)
MSSENVKLFRIVRTCWEMLRDRGYLVPQEKLDMGFEQFVQEQGMNDQLLRDNLTIIVPKQTDPQDQIIVLFPPEEKLGTGKIQEYVQRMKEDDIYRAILVLQRKLSAPANQERMLVRNTFRIEDFLESELLVNITKHVMVPLHTVLSKDEKETLLKRYKVKETQLPRIQLADPVAKYLGMERGEVVRIVRASETAGRYVTYRYCV